MKKYLLIPILCVCLMACASTKGLDEAFERLSDLKQQEIAVVEDQLDRGEITPSEYIEAVREIERRYKQEGEELAEEFGDAAGGEIALWIQWALGILLGVPIAGAGVYAGRRSIQRKTT